MNPITPKHLIKQKFIKKRMKRLGLFGISFCFFGFVWLLLGGQIIQWFNLFGQRTAQQHSKIGDEYVKNADVDNAVVGTVLAQIALGNGSFKIPKTNNDVFTLFTASQLLVNTDILTLVKNAENPEKAIDTHLAHTQVTIDQITVTASNLADRAQTHIVLAQECLADKRTGDSLFFAGVNELNQIKTDRWLNQSLEFAPCYISNRIKANAYSYLAQKVQTNQRLLAQRATLLTNNKTLLVNNSAYLEWDILEQLLQLKRSLLAINTPVVTQWAQRLFDFTTLDPNEPIPNFGVFFKDHGLPIPSYQSPWIELTLSS